MKNILAPRKKKSEASLAESSKKNSVENINDLNQYFGKIGSQYITKYMNYHVDKLINEFANNLSLEYNISKEELQEKMNSIANTTRISTNIEKQHKPKKKNNEDDICIAIRKTGRYRGTQCQFYKLGNTDFCGKHQPK